MEWNFEFVIFGFWNEALNLWAFAFGIKVSIAYGIRVSVCVGFELLFMEWNFESLKFELLFFNKGMNLLAFAFGIKV